MPAIKGIWLIDININISINVDANVNIDVYHLRFLCWTLISILISNAS